MLDKVGNDALMADGDEAGRRRCASTAPRNAAAADESAISAYFLPHAHTSAVLFEYMLHTHGRDKQGAEGAQEDPGHVSRPHAIFRPASRYACLTLWNSYNQRREDFQSKEEWDDYLEMVEDISETLRTHNPDGNSRCDSHSVRSLQHDQQDRRPSDRGQDKRISALQQGQDHIQPSACGERGLVIILFSDDKEGYSDKPSVLAAQAEELKKAQLAAATEGSQPSKPVDDSRPGAMPFK